MANSGHGQFPLCTFVRNFKHLLLLNKWSELHMIGQKWLLGDPLQNKPKKIDLSKNWPSGGVSYHYNKGFINLKNFTIDGATRAC